MKEGKSIHTFELGEATTWKVFLQRSKTSAEYSSVIVIPFVGLTLQVSQKNFSRIQCCSDRLLKFAARRKETVLNGCHFIIPVKNLLFPHPTWTTSKAGWRCWDRLSEVPAGRGVCWAGRGRCTSPGNIFHWTTVSREGPFSLTPKTLWKDSWTTISSQLDNRSVFFLNTYFSDKKFARKKKRFSSRRSENECSS